MKRILLAAVIAVLAFAAPARAWGQGYLVVVNAASSVSTISKPELANIFLKKSSKLAPVDQAKTVAVREAFSKGVHGRSASAIASYWQQQFFAAGEVPPAEKPSDAEVLAFVRSTPNGVGYVAAGTDLGAGVKLLTVK